MHMDELRKMSQQDIGQKTEELQLELMKLNAQIASGTIPKNPSRVKNIKRILTQMKMVLPQQAKQPSEAQLEVAKKP